jgi:hypothetical protein
MPLPPAYRMQVFCFRVCVCVCMCVCVCVQVRINAFSVGASCTSAHMHVACVNHMYAQCVRKCCLERLCCCLVMLPPATCNGVGMLEVCLIVFPLCGTGVLCHLFRAGQDYICTCIYSLFGRELTKYTVIYGAYIRFWPTLHLLHNSSFTCR